MNKPCLIHELKTYLDKHHYLSREYLKSTLLPEINKWRREVEGKEYDLDNAYRRLRQICHENQNIEADCNENGSVRGWKRKIRLDEIMYSEEAFKEAQDTFLRNAFNIPINDFESIKHRFDKLERRLSEDDRLRIKKEIVWLCKTCGLCG